MNVLLSQKEINEKPMTQTLVGLSIFFDFNKGFLLFASKFGILAIARLENSEDSINVVWVGRFI